MRGKATELRIQLIDVMEHFGEKNLDIPAQVLMAALGELLIQFSVDHFGPNITSEFLDDLKEAVRKFSPAEQ